MQNEVLKCDECNYSTDSKSNLTKHRRIHTGEKKFLCERCGKQFSDSSNLKKHEIKCSGGSFPCRGHCDQTFSSASLVTRHLQKVGKTMDTRKVKRKCPFCKKEYTNDASYHNHIQNVHQGTSPNRNKLNITKSSTSSNAATTTTTFPDNSVFKIPKQPGSMKPPPAPASKPDKAPLVTSYQDDPPITHPLTQANPDDREILRRANRNIYSTPNEPHSGKEDYGPGADHREIRFGPNEPIPPPMIPNQYQKEAKQVPANFWPESDSFGGGMDLPQSQDFFESTPRSSQIPDATIMNVNDSSLDNNPEGNDRPNDMDNNDSSPDESHNADNIQDESEMNDDSVNLEDESSKLPQGESEKRENEGKSLPSPESSPKAKEVPQMTTSCPEFLIPLWKITKNFATIDTSLTEDDQLAVDYLCSSGIEMNGYVIAALLEKNIEKTIGLFPAALITMTHAQGLQVAELITLYNKTKDSSSKVHSLHKRLIKQLLQNSTQTHLPQLIKDSDFLPLLPEDILGALHFDVLQLPHENNSPQSHASRIQNLQREGESKVDLILRESITITTTTMKSAENNEIKLLDKSFSDEERATYWTVLLNSITKKISYSKNIMNINKHVIMTAQIFKNGTVPYLKIKSGDNEIPLHLHLPVIQKFTSCKAAMGSKVVEAAIRDVELFLMLLYNREENEEIIPNQVTVRLLELVQAAGVVSPWEFLFGRATHIEIDDISTGTLEIIIKIAALLQRKQEVSSLWKVLKSRYFPHVKYDFVKGLTKPQLNCLFSIKELENEELIRYRMLLVWAYDQAKVLCNDVEKARYNSEVAPHFLSVKGLLDIAKLVKVYPKIASQCYITFNDIESVNN